MSWGARRIRARRCAAALSAQLGFPVVAESDARRVGRRHHRTATPADMPILKAAWLEPGERIWARRWARTPSAIKSSSGRRPAPMSPTAWRRRGAWDCTAPSRRARSAWTQAFAELGAVARPGARPRRPRASPSPTYTGTGVQDTAIETLAHQRAVAAGVGTAFDTGGAGSRADASSVMAGLGPGAHVFGVRLPVARANAATDLWPPRPPTELRLTAPRLNFTRTDRCASSRRGAPWRRRASTCRDRPLQHALADRL